MRRSRSHRARFIGLSLGVVLVVLMGAGPMATPRQAELTEEEYGPMMTEIRFIVGDAELHVDARYWPDLGEDLDKLFPMFRQIEAFWTARGNDGALAFTQEALVILKEIGDAGIAMEQGPARASIRTLRTTCASCHEAHREETADGYRIKPGS
jgi:cytochrome c553